MSRSLLLAFVLAAAPTLAHAAPSEREAAALELGGKTPLAISVLRVRGSDGGLKLKLVVSGKGEKKKPATVTLYEGGGDDDGPGDKAFRSATLESFALPGGARGVRVDFEFQVAGSKKHRQTDTYLASVDDAPKLILDVTTKRDIDRSKVCHEVEDTSLTLDKDGRLFVRPVGVLESDLNDDDLPIDKTCHGKRAGTQITYKFAIDTFVQIDPPPAPAKKKVEEEEEGDD